ncbi:polysaccharide biosynthesis protein [Actinospica sp. MGRD01-02]|uniref:Polysaccharide biosynthesis protein n=1 Tax=Actinospica acidithermotolerans TaxID=2828514 RepID=A0A941II66_9ACTN|nr:polysaccharide biosynthesis protein [Actinospica acidithermotolerans]
MATNVFGTRNVLQAAARCGAGTVVTASTGKALRPYSPDVYAASKRIGEWILARTAATGELRLAASRFTHVVDNSIIGERLRSWCAKDEPIRLHSAEIGFYIQSALESAQLPTRFPATPAATTASRFRCVPATAPAASAPPKSMIGSEGTGMQADSASMSTNIARYP